MVVLEQIEDRGTDIRAEDISGRPLAFAADPDERIRTEGAACEGGRSGRVVSAKVRALIQLVGGDGDDGDARWKRPGEIGIDEVAG